MTQAYVPGQNDPHQEPINTNLTYGEAVRAIADRVSFASEDIRDAVYAALEREHNPPVADEDDDDEDQGDDTGSGDTPASTDGNRGAVKTTPAKKTAAPAKR